MLYDLPPFYYYYGHGFLFHRYVKINAYIVFQMWNSSNFSQWKVSQTGSISFPVNSLKHFLWSGTRQSWLILGFSYIRPGITISPWNSGSFLKGIIFRNQDLEAMYVHCYWGVIISETFQSKEQRNIFLKS